MLALGLSSSALPALVRENEPRFAQVSIQIGRAGCAVELDSTPVGKTNEQGALVLAEVDPTDHYVHIHCPGEREMSHFIAPRSGQKVEIQHEPSPRTAVDSLASGVQFAELRLQLRSHVQQAISLRARGRIEEAVQHLRDATKIDPDNSDLHRELGITFLLDKDWKRARVEMLEAIRNDPTDADAHNRLGYALEKLGDIEGAVKEYRIATRLEPDDSTYRQHYFQALGKQAALQARKKK